MLHKAWNSKGEMPYRFPRSSVQFQGHKVQNITDFDPTWAFPDYRPVAAFRSLRFALFPILPQFYVPFYVKKTKIDYFMCLFTPQPFGLEGYCRHGSGGRPGGRAGGCQTCGTHISVTAWRIFSIRSSMELSRPVVVHCHGNFPICPIWACPWAKNLSNLPQIGSRLCGTHISETAGWIYPI